MHQGPPPRRRRALLAALAGALLLLAALVGPAAAVSPGPIQIPALSGVVTDTCSGLPVDGLSVGVAPIDPASGNPGPIQHPPNPNLPGLFSYPALDSGAYQLTVAAPGYVPLGADPATGAAGDVTVTINPGPINLPAGQSFAAGQLLDVRLVPLAPGATCKPPSPNLPAVFGRGVDAATGMGLSGLSVALAPIVVDPATGEANPGPAQHPPSPNFLGFFAFRDPGPVNLGLQFYAAAPGHTSLGADPTKPPNPNAPLGPGVLVQANPGPQQLPTGSGSVTVSVVIGVALPAGPTGG